MTSNVFSPVEVVRKQNSSSAYLPVAGAAGVGLALITQPASAQSTVVADMESGIDSLSGIATAAAGVGIGALVIYFGFKLWRRTMG